MSLQRCLCRRHTTTPMQIFIPLQKELLVMAGGVANVCPLFPRSKQIESACFSGTAAFMEVRIQSVVVEFILNHVDVLFSSKLSSVIRESAGNCVVSQE